MSNESDRIPGLDDDKALDAAEVKALIAALRSRPEAVTTLRETFERVKDRLTPAGRALYRRELLRLQQRRPTVPRRIEDLLDGEYLIACLGDDCSEGHARLRCTDGALSVELTAFDEIPLQIEAGLDGRFEKTLAVSAGEVQVHGELTVNDGYLFLSARVSATLQGRKMRVSLTGVADVRASRA